jgi:alginate O-acetyltransferase complex protein AlgI
LWHGANWTFVGWGLFLGIFICIEQAVSKKVKLPTYVSVIFVNLLIMYCLLWFKADSVSRVWRIHHTIFTNWTGGIKIGSALSDVFVSAQFMVVFFIAFLVFILGDAYSHKIIPSLSAKPKAVRWLGYYALIILIAFLGVSMNAPAFVYFKF